MRFRTPLKQRYKITIRYSLDLSFSQKTNAVFLETLNQTITFSNVLKTILSQNLSRTSDPQSRTKRYLRNPWKPSKYPQVTTTNPPAHSSDRSSSASSRRLLLRLRQRVELFKSALNLGRDALRSRGLMRPPRSQPSRRGTRRAHLQRLAPQQIARLSRGGGVLQHRAISAEPGARARVDTARAAKTPLGSFGGHCGGAARVPLIPAAMMNARALRV